MSNAVSSTGITIDTPAQTLDKFLNGTADYPGMLAIYGSDINVEPNSPDGQFVNIGVQLTQDMLEFILQVFSSFDPDQAIGVALDERCAINGVFRNAGTYTYTDILVTVTQAVTLAGLDTAPDAPFTVADASGNQFVLVDTHVFGAAGSASLSFRAKVLGAVLTTPNTITTITTVTLGVSSVNNPAAATATGTNEETDYALRIRRARSVALPSKGFFDGLYGALIGVEGVSSVKLLENVGSTVDANGIPGHSIWAIVQGGTNADIAQAIYVKRNAGCGMKGAVSVNVTQVDNSVFAVLFDRPLSQNLWIKLDVHAVTGSVDTAYIKAQILARLSYAIGQTATVSEIVTLVQTIAAESDIVVAVSGAQISLDGTTYVTTYINAPTVQHQFSIASARITVTAV